MKERMCKYTKCHHYDPRAKTYCCSACSADAYDDDRLHKEKIEQRKKWDKKKEKAFAKTLKLFIDFLKTQDQLNYAIELVPGFTYTHVTSWNHVDNCRCILWCGILNKLDDDAQLNVNINVFGEDIGEGRIYTHKKGLPLTKGWHTPEPVNADDMTRELMK